MAKRIGGNGDEVEDVVLYGGLLAAAYFFVIRPISNIFGASDEDKATLAAITTQDPTTNPFSPLFQPAVDYVNAHLGGYANAQAMWDSIEQGYKLGSYPTTGFGFAPDAGVLAHQIYGDLGILNNNDDIMAVFNSLPDQVSCAFIAMYFAAELNADLVTKLQDGLLSFSWLKGGMPVSDIAIIINHVNSLPVNSSKF